MKRENTANARNVSINLYIEGIGTRPRQLIFVLMFISCNFYCSLDKDETEMSLQNSKKTNEENITCLKWFNLQITLQNSVSDETFNGMKQSTFWLENSEQDDLCYD